MATEREKTKASIIAKCTCVHPFQDSIYGVGMRVFSIGQKKDSTMRRCTVCKAGSGK